MSSTVIEGRPRQYIDGQWVDASSGRTFSVHNPATGEELAAAPDAGPQDAARAVEAAHRVFPDWSALAATQRAKLLFKVRDLMLERKEALARTLTSEQGKPLVESRGEIAYAAGFVAWFAEEAKRVYGETIPASVATKRLLVIKQPIGVVAAITPWNFPAAMVTRKIAAALAAGCTVVLKPAEQTPLTAIALCKIFEEAGLPGGVVNCITTSDPGGVGRELLENPLVRMITFTGSVEVGKLLMRGASEHVKRVSLELGGHAPFIVFEDADVDKAVAGAVASKFRNMGQTCICANRMYVHESILESFAAKFVEQVKRFTLGNGLDEGVQVGPLIDEQGFKKVCTHVEDAIAKGAKVLTGGKPRTEGPFAQGRFFEPTVLTDVRKGMRILEEETFGPVAPLISFRDEAEVIRAANDTRYGLAAYFYSQNVSRCFRVAEQLEYGIIGVNDGSPSVPQAPFGGVKESGLGREGGREGIEEFLEVKFLSLGL
ncbi:MAG: NAD-dependent succinate-semialdehyde dehydrogenase [Candidatus Methylomirabilales bacterium]